LEPKFAAHKTINVAGRIVPIILSGGAGTRLWPMSRGLHPKQLLSLTGTQSLLKEAVLSVRDPGLYTAPVVVCNENHRFLVAEQLREIDVLPQAILVEPVARSTAPATAAAAMLIRKSEPDALLLVLPADHNVKDPSAFQAAVDRAIAAAARGMLVAFGVTPNRPETGFGYIRCREPLDGVPGCFIVDKFIEKPDHAHASEYVESGMYVWNCGRFLFRGDAYLSELARYEPEIVAACQLALDGACGENGFLNLNCAAFATAPARSIDCAVMERTERAALVQVDMGWNDIGSWSTLWDIGVRDATDNVILGDVVTMETERSYVRTEGQLVATLGVKDLAIVATDDAVLVAPRERSQDVRLLVDRLRSAERKEVYSHRTVHRPWGCFRSLDLGEGFQVKRITLKPGARISLQKHKHRAEHWVVVQGRARVTRNEEVFELGTSESATIPLGTVHRLENAGNELLHLIEVQTGTYLGEDDIIRLEDNYGRV
jgi:mannose-1-phosphate guanylyltransferase / mannose-6-phosphate isomerase